MVITKDVYRLNIFMIDPEAVKWYLKDHRRKKTHKNILAW